MGEERSKSPRRWGDRRDGRWVKAPGLQTIMSYLMPKRTDCEVYLHDTIDATELTAWLAERNALHPEYKTTVFHCFVTVMARMVRERPKMNRFIQGWRMFERDEVSLSFVAKRRFADGADESLMVFVPGDGDTLDDVSRKIAGDVREMRKSETSTGGIDALLDSLAKLPRLFLAAFVRVVRWLEFLSNLGSIRCPAVYHHLNNYGTNSIMITVGTLHKEKLLMDDGSEQIRDVIDIGATLDERIADGFYFARSLRLAKHIFAHPELLDRPLGEESGFEY